MYTYIHCKLSASKLASSVTHIAERKVLSKILNQRKLFVSEFLSSVRKVNDFQISPDDFGQSFHTYTYIVSCAQVVY